MTTAKFYVDPAEIGEGRLRLDGAYHHHLSRVLRMRKGQSLQLMDGMGGVANGSILEISSTYTSIVVGEVYRVEEERPRMILYQALPQGNKMDAVVQWSVELGAAAVVPFCCSRSRPMDHNVNRRHKRWCRIAEESSRVAGRPYLPEVGEVCSWPDLLEKIGRTEMAIMADETGGERPSVALDGEDPAELGLAIGPEGGFSSTERCELLAEGARPVTLGQTVLRTETAGMVLLAAARSHFGLL
ncbi:MAG: 16S rRNA (uracil(1498)-N(3))-methyltransferase [Actinobacteria bacterium]|nr:16S rRNA (uracil(1498)-N(3))-methyltransferase [Actinomycetota bacterium]